MGTLQKIPATLDTVEQQYPKTLQLVMITLSIILYRTVFELFGIYPLFSNIFYPVVIIAIIFTVLSSKGYLFGRFYEPDSIFQQEPIASVLNRIQKSDRLMSFRRGQLPWKETIFFGTPFAFIICLVVAFAVPLGIIDHWFGEMKKEIEKQVEEEVEEELQNKLEEETEEE